VFFLAGAMYVIICPANIVSGNATVQIDPPLAADAAAALALTDFNVLATDADLTQQDSVMPALAQRVVDSETGKDAYDGKRALAKRDIASWLWKREFDPAGVKFPWDFNRAATFLELAYIYSDMSRRNEGIANEKAALYRRLYEEEIESVKFQYEPPMVPEQKPPDVRTTACLWRA
jgi:hypothetical protein